MTRFAWREIPLASFLVISIIFLQVFPIFAAPEFSVSPVEFTVKNVPPRGESYVMDRKITLWNRGDNSRLMTVDVMAPPVNDVTPGYEPIPNENWVRPVPTSVTVEENSSADILISLNIPRWENLTNRKWEVWIPVTRQPFPGEPAIIELTVKMKIETTQNLPPPPPGGMDLPYLLIAGGAAVIAVVVVTWLLLKGRGGKKRIRWSIRSSRSSGLNKLVKPF